MKYRAFYEILLHRFCNWLIIKRFKIENHFIANYKPVKCDEIDEIREWKMKNEEWRMKNEEWRMKNEEWRMKNEEFRKRREQTEARFQHAEARREINES